jgi:hypothetical protein
MSWGFESLFTTNTDNQIETAHIWTRIFDLDGNEGDELTMWFNWEHETLFAPFPIQNNVVIPPGSYNFYSLFGELRTAAYRPLALEVIYKVGEFYDGDQYDVRTKITWRPSPHFNIILQRRKFDINLPQGNFDIEIHRARFDINFTPTLSWTNYLQQESETHIATLQSQLRWIIAPGNELTMTVNHDWAKEDGSYRSTEADFFTRFVWTHRF